MLSKTDAYFLSFMVTFFEIAITQIRNTKLFLKYSILVGHVESTRIRYQST
jgi:hypothetical protein